MRYSAEQRRAASKLRRKARSPQSAARAALAVEPAGLGAFGYNGENQLGGTVVNGYGSPPYSASVYLEVQAPTGAVQLAAGANFFQALYADGTVRAWGSNNEGGLGIGSNGFLLRSPTLVPLNGVTQIAAGSEHSLMLTPQGLFGSGPNSSGELGFYSCCGYFTTPQPVTTISDLKAVAASQSQSLGLKNDGTVWEWGDNVSGTMADGSCDYERKNRREPGQVVGLTDVKAISAGIDADMALRTDGTVWIWADGSCGLATQVPGINDATALGSGGGVIRAGGTLWIPSRSGATQVPGLSGVTQVSTRYGSWLALKSDGSVWGWGKNEYGQLGNGTKTDAATPVRVRRVSGAVAVATTSMSGAVAAASIDGPDQAPSVGPTGGPLTPRETFGGSNPASTCVQVAQGRCGDPVNTADGNFFDSYSDISVPGRGVPLAFERTYNSLNAAQDGQLGYGWSFSYGMTVKEDAASGKVTVAQENGSEVVFAAAAGGAYTAPPRVLASLKRETDNTWTFTRRAKTKFLFSPGGRLTGVRDLNGYTTQVSYPAADRIVATEPAGRTLTMNLTSGRIASVADSATPARTASFVYDASGDLTAATDVGGGVTRFSYNAEHRIVTVREPKYATDTTTTPTPQVTNVYDTEGRVVAQTDPLGATTQFDYTSIASATKVTEPNGKVTLDRYENGLRVSTTEAFGTRDAATSTFAYDLNTLSLTDACDSDGRCSTASFDSRGNVLTQTDGLGRTTTTTYNALDDVTSTTDPAGVTTTTTYDAAGNVLTQSRPLLDGGGATTAVQKTTFRYGATTPVYAGDVTSITDANGKSTQYRYDSFGNRISETLPATPENANGNKTTFAYDTATGWLTATTSAKGNLAGAPAGSFTTRFSHDRFGRVVQTRDPLWSAATPTVHRQTSTFDANGNLATETDANNNTTTYVFDAANRLTKTTRADNTVLRNEYRSDGRLLRRYDANNKPTSYEYNPLGYLSKAVDASDRVRSFYTDTAGNVVRSCDNACTSNTYDAAGQLTAINYDLSGTPDVSIAYDALGRRSSMTDGTGSSTWVWDSLGRMTSSTDGYANKVSYGYDLLDNRTAITYPGNLTVTQTFDAVGRMASLKEWKNNTTTFAYDADSNLVTTTRPATSGVVDTFGRDDAGSLTNVRTAKGATTLAAFAYTRDSSSQLATTTTTGISEPTQGYSYSALQQLKRSGTTAAPISYSYNATGDLTARGSSSTLTYDATSRLCWKASAVVADASCATPPASATTYTFDNNGNRTKATTGATVAAYGYDQANRLTAYKTTATYKYDGSGLRLSKTVSGATQRFVWDRAAGTEQLLADGANKYVYGPDGLPLEQITNAGTVTYLHHDQLGSTRLITSTAGVNIASYSYDAYGTSTATTGTATTPLGYAGEYFDTESGLIYMRARYYDPPTGQFLSRDPLEQITQQPYAYTDGNPINRVDPSGLLFGIPGTPSVGDIASATSNAAAGILNGLSLGYSTRLAGEVFGFDASCADFGAGYGTGNVIGQGLGLFGAGSVRVVAVKGAERVGAFSPLIPEGAVGPLPTRAPGFQYVGGRGGSGLHPNVTGVRFMDATNHHASPRVYMNDAGQTVDPFTGRTISPDEPMAHIRP